MSEMARVKSPLIALSLDEWEMNVDWDP